MWPLALSASVACTPQIAPAPKHPVSTRVTTAHARYHQHFPSYSPTHLPPPSPFPSPSPQPQPQPSPHPQPQPQPQAQPSPQPRPCGQSAWSTYAHDAARTSASDACLTPPLRVTWAFSPPPFAGRKERVEHAITSTDGVLVAGVRGQSPVLHRIAATDARTQWTFDSRADIARAPWPTAAHGIVMFVDDGVNVLNDSTGAHTKIALDYWGPSLADEARFYVANTWQEEGPGLFVGAFDAAAKPLWKGDKFQARGIVISEANGIALDGGVLFHAANYHFATQSFVTAIDPATGAVQWKVLTAPASAPSAADGRVYLVEQSPHAGSFALVARSQKNGAVLWSAPVNRTRTFAPVIAGSAIIVQDDAGITAFNADAGTHAWSTPLASKPSASRNATSLAAAMGSETLLVTAAGQVHVLALASGRVQWSGTPQAGAADVHSPIIVSGAAYVVADGALVRLDGTPN